MIVIYKKFDQITCRPTLNNFTEFEEALELNHYYTCYGTRYIDFIAR